jgi:hypothetical protein
MHSTYNLLPIFQRVSKNIYFEVHFYLVFQDRKENTMEWYHYLGAFCSGAFLTNFVPHFVNGVSGNRFPTPFAKPHGKGLSSPLLNVVWSLFNLIAGFLLFRFAEVSSMDNLSLIIFFAGVASLSIRLSKTFAGKNKI